MESAPKPNRRPSPEQAAWCRRDNADKHRLDQKRHAEGKPSDPKRVRLAAVRLKELQRIFRDSSGGATLPDGDVGSLELLANYAIWARKNPQHQISTWASWCDAAEAERIIWSASTYPVWHEPDELGREIGLTYAVRKRLVVRTIRGVDASSEDEMERLRCDNRNANKRRKRAARQESSTMETSTAVVLTPRQRKVLAKIDGAEIAVPELIKRVAGLKEFRKLAEPRREVHKIIDHLVAIGLVVDRNEPNPQGGKVRFVWHQQ
jgi:hypothetical protein